MTLDEAKTHWQTEEPVDEPTGDDPMSGEQILTVVRDEAHAFETAIRKRDRREFAAVALNVIVFGGVAVVTGSWMIRGGAVLVVLGSLLIAWKLRCARPGDPASSAASQTVADRLRTEIETVQRQIDLLESVLWWYVAPLMTGGLLMTLGQSRYTWFTYVMVAVWLGVGVGVWHLNRRAVRDDLRPRRKQLDALLQQIEP